MIDGDVAITYTDLLERARSFGAALAASGIEPGDRVAIWAPNSARWIVSVLGLWQAGAVLVPINTRFKGAEAADILRRSHARALLTVGEFLGTDYVAMLDGFELPDLATSILMDTSAWDDFIVCGRPACVATGGRLRRRVRHPLHLRHDRSTQGCRADPRSNAARRHRLGRHDRLTAGDRYLMVNPYFHMFGLKAGILACVAAGATMLPEPVFDVGRALARVEADRVTVLPGAPTLYQSILDHPDRAKYDLSTLRVAVTGAADIPVELIRRIVDELSFPTIITGYGLTEGGTASATSPDDDIETIATTVGRLRPGFEARITDDKGDDVASGEAGEIRLRGGSIMSHYLDDPEATAQTLSADGWLRTGDLGVIDAAGCLHIVGRSKDMFIVGGFNAYPPRSRTRCCAIRTSSRRP